jgi:hypothetical protein
MRNSPERTCRICFLVLANVGFGFLGVGLIMPILPYFQLDAVLTPSELADPQKVASTLALLKKAVGNEGLLWALGGLVVIVTSVIGYRATNDLPAVFLRSKPTNLD